MMTKMKPIEFTVAVQTQSPLNGSQGTSRRGMAMRAAHRRRQKQSAYYEAVAARQRDYWESCHLPAVVMLTRKGSRALDGDNLQGALKGVRDGIAAALGVDDADPRVTWRYEQRKCPRAEFGVVVRIEAA